ncbi:MAG: sulfite exporter TauE/SafE family protein [Actinomycetota bacterium]
MSEWELLIIAVAAVLTAAITAVAGAGGGVVLLVVILQFEDPLIAVPAHGVIQLVSNGTRAVTLRDAAETRLLRWYVPLLVPGTIVGYLVADSIPRDGGRAIIGAFALLAVWWPAATAWLAPRGGSHRRLTLLGGFNGLLNPTIGATGPLIAPAFRTITADHVSFVATFAVVQVINHIAKVAVFGIAGFAFREHLPMILIASVGVFVGTRIGARYLKRWDPEKLGLLFQVAVTAGAVRLLVGVL